VSKRAIFIPVCLMLIYSIFASAANRANQQRLYELPHRFILNQVCRKGSLTDPGAPGGGGKLQNTKILRKTTN
jgi:hypothetical protein